MATTSRLFDGLDLLDPQAWTTATLRTLPEAPRTLVFALGAFGVGVTRHQLAALLVDVAGLIPPALLRAKDLKPALMELAHVGLVRETRPGYWALTPGLRESAARAAQGVGRFPAFFTPSSRRLDHTAFQDSGYSLRKVRAALLAGDEKGVYSALGEASAQEIHPLVRICGEPFEAEWFEAIPGPLRSLAAWEIGLHGLVPGPLNHAFRTWLDARSRSTPEPWLAAAMANFLAFEGRFEEALAWTEAIPTVLPIREALRAHAFLGQGRVPEALAGFRASHKAFRVATGKRQGFLPGLFDLNFILALLGSGSAADFKECEDRIALLEKRSWQDPLHHLGEPLTALLRTRRGARLDASSPLGSNEIVLTKRGRLGTFVDTLAQAWTADDLSSAQAREAASRLKDLPWFQGAALEVARRAEGEAAQPNALVDLVPRQPRWERALTALRALGTTAPDKETVSRLVWRIIQHGDRPSDLEIEPREQKKDAKGQWTKGRVLSLRKLKEDSSAYAFLQPHDLRAIQHIDVNRSYWGTHAEVDPGAIRSLVCHPFVFWSEHREDMGSPVELLAGASELRLKELGDQLELTLHPPPAPGGFGWQREGPRRVRVFAWNDAHLRLAGILGQGLRVPKSAQAQVLATLGSLAPLAPVHADQELDSEGLEARPADAGLHALLTPFEAGLRVELRVRPLPDGAFHQPGEGGASLLLDHGGQRVLVRRNLEQERRSLAELLAQCPALDEDAPEAEWCLPDPEEALEALMELDAIKEVLTLHWPEGQPFRTPRATGLAQLSLKVGGKGDWFDVSGELALDEGQVMSMKALLDLLDQQKGRFVRLPDGAVLALGHSLRRRLEDLRSLGEPGKTGLRLARPAALSMDDLGEGLGAFSAGKEWTGQAARIQKAMALKPRVPTAIEAELRPYQEEAFRWASRLAAAGFGACLADDMGLGKTIVTLALLQARAKDGPALVIAPTSVVANWQLEALRFAPALRVSVLHEGDREALISEAGKGEVLLCSYGLLVQEAERLAARTWTTLVLDEAQALKNAATQRSQAAVALQAEFRILLSGTPMENHLLELWALFRVINPGLLGGIEAFQRRFQRPIELDRDPEALARLRRLIGPFILRRTKAQVLEDLPPRTEITLSVELSPEEGAFLEALRVQSLEALAEQGPVEKKALQVLAAIMRLRRAACHADLVQPGLGLPASKLDAFKELVEELRDNRHRALVFSQFVDHLAILRRWLDEAAIPYQFLDGSTPAKARQKAVEAFQAGEGNLFLISLRAGGTGLNLTGADYVIHMDPWWNPAVEEQATGRAHRMGQERPVTIYRLVAKGSIEEKILALHHTKRELADSLLAGEGLGAKLDAKALMALLKDEG